MIHFAGTSFAARHLREAARQRGLTLTNEITEANLVFVSEDSLIEDGGRRNTREVTLLLDWAHRLMPGHATLVLTSQVEPGYSRRTGFPLYHQAETLRVKDAAERALNPEQIIVGCEEPSKPLPPAYLNYVIAFNCPVFQVTWEEAEFSKIAINMTLAAQVDNTNRLAAAAARCGAKWDSIVTILKHDARIGQHSYLEPGDWRQSKHLLRDYVTLKEIEDGN